MSSRRVEDLHPDFQPMVRELLKQGSTVMPDGYSFFITDGYRSMEEQQTIYNQGRTTPGKIVTMALPGQSAHNYGLAVDMAFQKGGKLYYDVDLYSKIYPIARDLGFVLGADWTDFPDRPHFEYPSWKDKKNGKDVIVQTREEKNYEVVDHHRNVTVNAIEGVNVRYEPNSQSTILTLWANGLTFSVKGWTKGQDISGNDKWWVTMDDYFIWSGATNVIPTEAKPQREPVPEPKVEPATTSNNNTSELESRIKELESKVLSQSQLLESKDTELAQHLSRISTIEQDASNVLAIKQTNESLVTQIEAYKDKNIQLKADLGKAYVQAFDGWELMELPQGPKGLAQLPMVLFKVIRVIIASMNDVHVLGFKRGARLYSVTSDGSEQLVNNE